MTAFMLAYSLKGAHVHEQKGVVFLVGALVVPGFLVVVGGSGDGKGMGLTFVTALLKTRRPMSEVCKQFLVFSSLLVKSNQSLLILRHITG
jgi:hypothetical protein